MKNLILIICFVFLIPASVQAEMVSKDVRLEKVRSFSTKELWNSTRSITVNSGDTSMIYRVMDNEAVSIKSGWYPCALVMIGNGDLGVTPISFRLWTRRNCKFEVVALSNLDSRISIYLMTFENQESVEVRVDTSLSVLIGGRNIGQILMPR